MSQISTHNKLLVINRLQFTTLEILLLSWLQHCQQATISLLQQLTQNTLPSCLLHNLSIYCIVTTTTNDSSLDAWLSVAPVLVYLAYAIQWPLQSCGNMWDLKFLEWKVWWVPSSWLQCYADHWKSTTISRKHFTPIFTV